MSRKLTEKSEKINKKLIWHEQNLHYMGSAGEFCDIF
jgi:hypothetical protein